MSGNASSVRDANSTPEGLPGRFIAASMPMSPDGVARRNKIFRAEGSATATPSIVWRSSQMQSSASGSPGRSAVTCSENTILLMP